MLPNELFLEIFKLLGVDDLYVAGLSSPHLTHIAHAVLSSFEQHKLSFWPYLTRKQPFQALGEEAAKRLRYKLAFYASPHVAPHVYCIHISPLSDSTEDKRHIASASTNVDVLRDELFALLHRFPNLSRIWASDITFTKVAIDNLRVRTGTRPIIENVSLFDCALSPDVVPHVLDRPLAILDLHNRNKRDSARWLAVIFPRTLGSISLLNVEDLPGPDSSPLPIFPVVKHIGLSMQFFHPLTAQHMSALRRMFPAVKDVIIERKFYDYDRPATEYLAQALAVTTPVFPLLTEYRGPWEAFLLLKSGTALERLELTYDSCDPAALVLGLELIGAQFLLLTNIDLHLEPLTGATLVRLMAYFPAAKHLELSLEWDNDLSLRPPSEKLKEYTIFLSALPVCLPQTMEGLHISAKLAVGNALPEPTPSLDLHVMQTALLLRCVNMQYIWIEGNFFELGWNVNGEETDD
ncbi:F-box domain-containing protein [Mycena indigotica]|uniref:F-box domain-containing protein n=1 Tax=Mycena indigotica TaxID=2126181 RepID=A0A8H6SKJ8_9AGAR|nr:F-box domain-containing protein [Mycena indigotica]KAF7299530.1 F-box domain-containing protein [Mycena indigotica]